MNRRGINTHVNSMYAYCYRMFTPPPHQLKTLMFMHTQLHTLTTYYIQLHVHCLVTWLNCIYSVLSYSS